VCEQFVAWSPAPFRISELWPFVERLERYGIAGFGWGAAWRDADGCVQVHRDVAAFRDDHHGRERVGRQETSALLVHLRRPSRLSTIQLADTQPFADPAGRFAVSHNGELGRWREPRRRYVAQGRIAGRADSEVGARWLEDAWTRERPPREQLAALRTTFGGSANLALLEPSGRVTHLAGDAENPVFAFRLDGIAIASTGLYSADRSLFRLAARGATDRHRVKNGTAVTFGPV
jgi:glutamine phosphoribosylpyrophosphate amidotransferase